MEEMMDENPKLDLDVEESDERPVMSCYALDLDVEESDERPVMSCYALDLDNDQES